LLTLLLLVTEPLDVVPWVLTSSAPEVKIVAGPMSALADGALLVTGLAEPPDGRVTVGAGPLVWDGASMMLTLATKPRALPLTAVTWADTGATPTPASNPAQRTATTIPTRTARERACLIPLPST
jgi:hypothetical protein